MGKKLDALLGRNFKTSKFKKLVNLAISRIAYLEKEHRTRCSQARSDVIQLLSLGQQERALLRVEYVIREQNMLDAYSMIENYFNLLVERVVFIEKSRECPEELKEAVTSLIFAASRSGEMPELQKIRALFTSRFGKELASRAVDLRNNCGVNPKIVKKFSTRRPSLDSKLQVLREIAPTSEIVLQFEKEPPTIPPVEKAETSEQQSSRAHNKPSIRESLEPKKEARTDSKELEGEKKFLERTKEKKYKDAEAAAQAAYNMATTAAAAARATIELLISHGGADGKEEDGHEEKPNENSTGGHGVEERGTKHTRTTMASILSRQKLVKDKDVVEKNDEHKAKQVQPPWMPERKISLTTNRSLKSKRSGSVADENRDVLNYLISFENMINLQATPEANPPGEKPMQEESQQQVGEQKHSRSASMGRKPLSSRSRRANRG